MNLVLFEPDEIHHLLPLGDGRAQHLLQILKLQAGDRFVAGEIGGPWGSLGLAEKTPQGLRFADPDFCQTSLPLSAVRLLIGTPRPPTARRLLKDLTSLGAGELHFVATELGEKSYLQSHLWQGEDRQARIEGASQARSTLLPPVVRHASLAQALRQIGPHGPTEARVVFDEGGQLWDRHPALAASQQPLWLAIGPERGWSATERRLFEAEGWSIASLGPRVLRTETACTLALGLAVIRSAPSVLGRAAD